MLRNERYFPQVVQEFEIVKLDGRHRILAKYATVDRFLLRAIEQVMNEKIDQKLSSHCFAYRENMGVCGVVRCAAEYLQNGKLWVAEMDIEQYFDNIDLIRMETILDEYIRDKRLCNLLSSYIHCNIERDYKTYTKMRGLVQGNSLSPLLSNLYLLQFDRMLEEKGHSFIRYADNINIYVKTRTEAIMALETCRTALDSMTLALNKKKSGVYEGLKRRYLGYEFELNKKENKIISKKYRKTGNVQYRNWHATALQKVGKNYHIINDRVLTKKDFTLLFENEQGKRILPVETIDSVNIYSDVALNSGFFSYANQKRLRINFFDKYGKGIGSFVTENGNGNAKTMLKQAEKYLNEKSRLHIAKKIIMAGMHNLRANLRYYDKKKSGKMNCLLWVLYR